MKFPVAPESSKACTLSSSSYTVRSICFFVLSVMAAILLNCLIWGPIVTLLGINCILEKSLSFLIQGL